jgi:hypothetical protein
MSDYLDGGDIKVDYPCTQLVNLGSPDCEKEIIGRLVPFNPHVKSSQIELTPSCEVCIGRNPTCQVIFQQTEISGVHCRFYISEGQVILQDLR